jgi:fructokinase
VTRILVIGEAIADFLPDSPDGARYVCALGGSGFNTALALARLDRTPAFAWALSRDGLGQRFTATLAAEGVDLTCLTLSDAPTPVAIVQPLGASHGGMFALHLCGTAHEAADLPAVLPDGVLHVHAASFAATTGPAGDAALALMRAAASASYDPNIRAACLPPHAEALARVEARVAVTTVAKASEDDLGWLYPGLAPHEALQRWSMLGAGIAIATRGAKGALALSGDVVAEQPAPAVAVADTVGAGDTFTAGFLTAMAEDGALGRRASVADAAMLRRWLALGVAAASFTCARPGCDPPRRDQLR